MKTDTAITLQLSTALTGNKSQNFPHILFLENKFKVIKTISSFFSNDI